MPLDSPSASPHKLVLAGATLLLDPSGALLWPARRLLAVADLHLEKGSSYAAAGGRLLPPYDTAATLRRLEALIDRHAPAAVLCLGDSFHDGGAMNRMAPAALEMLRRLAAGRDWIWIAGNHDPAPPAGLGGRVLPELALDGLCFRHEARRWTDPAYARDGVEGEVSGHYHPVAALGLRGRRVRRRCFVSDGRRLVLPAFGAYAGGLNARDPAVAGLFPFGFTAFVLGRERLHALPDDRLRDDPRLPLALPATRLPSRRR